MLPSYCLVSSMGTLLAAMYKTFFKAAVRMWESQLYVQSGICCLCEPIWCRQFMQRFCTANSHTLAFCAAHALVVAGELS